MDRDKLWIEVLDSIAKVEKHLNTVGNDDLTQEDYIRITQIDRKLQGIENTYKES